MSRCSLGSFVIADVGAMGRLECLSGFETHTELHAFEPNPDEMFRLKQRYLNHPFSALTFNECALAFENSETHLYINNKASMSSLLEADHHNYKKHFGAYEKYPEWKEAIDASKKLKIRQCTADSYFRDAVVDLMKIDTQGSELDVLRGAAELLRERRISVLKIEVSTIPVYKGQCLFTDVDTYLRSLNYSLVDLITYHNDPPSFFSRKSKKSHSTSCGDAIYVCNEIPNSKSRLIKTAIILASQGYNSIAIHLLRAADLSDKASQEILGVSDLSAANMLKQSLKAVLPPIITWWMKKLYVALRR